MQGKTSETTSRDQLTFTEAPTYSYSWKSRLKPFRCSNTGVNATLILCMIHLLISCWVNGWPVFITNIHLYWWTLSMYRDKYWGCMKIGVFYEVIENRWSSKYFEVHEVVYWPCTRHQNSIYVSPSNGSALHSADLVEMNQPCTCDNVEFDWHVPHL